MAWLGCIEAMTPSLAKRGRSGSETICACSMRQRAVVSPARLSSNQSRVMRLPRSPMACMATWAFTALACLHQGQALVALGQLQAQALGVAIGLEQRRAARAQGAVHIELDPAHPDQAGGVVKRTLGQHLGGAAGVHVVVDAQAELLLSTPGGQSFRSPASTLMFPRPVQPREA
jgi:hypothetical protein